MAHRHSLKTRGKARSSPRAYVLAAMAPCAIAAAALAVLVPGGRPLGERVSLLPAPAAKNQSWAWTATCTMTPAAGGTCGPSSPDVGTAQLEGDEWNLGGSAALGSVTMSVGPTGTLEVQGDLVNSPPCTQAGCLAPSANTWVRGYPSILYGLSQCHPGASPPMATKLRLPVRVNAIAPDLVGTTSYSANAKKVTYDIAYDMWLNPSPTTAPCHADGTVEVMVWTDYDQRALLPKSMQIGTATIPFALNGADHTGAEAWSVFASNIDRDGQTAPWGGTVWLVLTGAEVVSEGTVSVDLSSALAEVGSLLRDTYGWRGFSEHYWLDTVPFGLEFGPGSATLSGNGPSHFSLALSAYCLSVGATVAGAKC
jgi:hypothetical protein